MAFGRRRIAVGAVVVLIAQRSNIEPDTGPGREPDCRCWVRPAFQGLHNPIQKRTHIVGLEIADFVAQRLDRIAAETEELAGVDS